MKQIIGYMEYDYMNIKYGLGYIALVFGIVSVAFSVRSGMEAIGYMLFGGLILSGATFTVTKQTVSFTALVPGSALQKVLGRYFANILCIIFCAVFGILSAVIVRAAGYDNGTIELPLLFCLVGATLLFLAIQNVMLYLLVPHLGVQFAGIIRMAPGFVLFFFVMNMGDMDIVPAILQYEYLPGVIMLAVGIAGLIISVFLSSLIIKNRDNE